MVNSRLLFWTDDPYWAHQWNEGHDTVISEFSITFDSKDELLDLVGNARDIRQFEAMRQKVASTLTRMSAVHITVNQVISFFRELEQSDDFKGVFPYAAVKAQDSTKASNLIRLNFVDERTEQMVSFTRQQMCVYEHARGKIEFRRFIFPEHFCEKD